MVKLRGVKVRGHVGGPLDLWRCGSIQERQFQTEEVDEPGNYRRSGWVEVVREHQRLVRTKTVLLCI